MSEAIIREEEAERSRNVFTPPDPSVFGSEEEIFDNSKCASCGKEFGLTLESAMRSRWASHLCVDCVPEAEEMLDDCDDTPV